MKTILARTLTIAAFSISLAALVAAQDIRINDNGGVRLQKISLFYRLTPTSSPQPAFGNYFVPNNITSLIFRIELVNKDIKKINYRVQIRQLCAVKLTPDASVTKEREILATTTPTAGKPVDINSGTFDLEIQIHPAPEGGVAHDKSKHCFGDIDHLGEGPHEASISIAQDNSLSQGSDSLHVLYASDFRPVAPDTLERMRGLERMTLLERENQLKSPQKKPNDRNR